MDHARRINTARDPAKSVSEGRGARPTADKVDKGEGVNILAILCKHPLRTIPKVTEQCNRRSEIAYEELWQ